MKRNCDSEHLIIFKFYIKSTAKSIPRLKRLYMKGKKSNIIAVFIDKNNIGTHIAIQESAYSIDKGLEFVAVLFATSAQLPILS